MTRTVEDIKNTLISYLNINNSPLTDFSTGSVNNTLIRSISALQLEQDVLLNDLQNNIHLSKSPGIYLDSKVADFGITRKAATYAIGNILVKDTTKVGINSVLTNLSNNNQYVITNSNNVVNSYNELSYTVKSVSPGLSYNLIANSKLTYLQDTTVSITVGNVRLDDLTVVGDISGGSDLESDSNLLNRFLSTLLDTRFSTPNAIKSFLLSQTNIIYASIDNPFPGHLTIWFASAIVFTSLDISNLKQSIQSYLPAGITFDLLPLQRQYISLNLSISINNTLSKDDICTKLTADVNNWFNSLSVNQSFDPQLLLNYLNSINFSFISNIQYQTSINTVTALPDHLISIGNLLFTFDNA